MDHFGTEFVVTKQPDWDAQQVDVYFVCCDHTRTASSNGACNNT